MNPTIILIWNYLSLDKESNQDTHKTFRWKNCHRNFFWYHQNPSRSDCWKRPLTSTTNHHQKTNQTTSIEKPYRLSLVLLARCTQFWKQAVLIIQPDTILRWYRVPFKTSSQDVSSRKMATLTLFLVIVRMETALILENNYRLFSSSSSKFFTWARFGHSR